MHAANDPKIKEAWNVHK